MSISFSRIVSTFYVADLQAERAFYTRLGFGISYEGEAFPELIALRAGEVEFGIELHTDFDPAHIDTVVAIQLGITDIDAAKSLLSAENIAYEEGTIVADENYRFRTLTIQTPNGYTVTLEGPQEA